MVDIRRRQMVCLGAILILLLLCIASANASNEKLTFNSDGTFKILQLTDIHWDPKNVPNHNANYISYLSGMLDAEKPDLVIITGDVVWNDAPIEEIFPLALAPIIERKIPWAFTLGNHDVESVSTGKEVINYLQKLPYSMVQPGPESLGGDGNYIIQLMTAQSGDKPAALLYLLNSHSQHEVFLNPSGKIEEQLETNGAKAAPDYQKLKSRYGEDAEEIFYAIRKFDKKQIGAALARPYEIQLKSGKMVKIGKSDFKILNYGEYDWIYPEQIQWYLHESASFMKENKGIPLPALMFFHIPLVEFGQLWNSNKVLGAKLEAECYPKRNSGMFAALLEHQDVMGVFCGHDHLDDYVGSLRGIALGYGRKTGMGCYGPAPMEKGGRILVMHEGESYFDTWIITESGKVENKIRIPDFFR